MPTGPGWVRLGQHMTSRRVALGYATQRALAEKTGLTERVIGKVETGRSVSRSTLAALELALRWEPGSAQAVLDGGKPAELPPDNPGSDELTAEDTETLADGWHEMDPEMRAAIRAWIRQVRTRRAAGQDGENSASG